MKEKNYIYVKSVEYGKTDYEVGCNNGNYWPITVRLNTGEELHGYKCRCGSGCNGTWRVPEKGIRFASVDELYDYMEE